MAGRQRLDVLLVERGLAESRARAQALIMAGEVKVDGAVVRRAGQPVAATAAISVAAPPRYVSRGGEKLAHALATFAVDPSGLVCADIGASTGGFTDCLLQHGAARVYAIERVQQLGRRSSASLPPPSSKAPTANRCRSRASRQKEGSKDSSSS
jgi:23S rRNA (cytidine1920-2'-O)/16S rRNA (cytidine1409-2'-O)-methyltransferase